MTKPTGTAARTYLYDPHSGRVVHLEKSADPAKAPSGCAGATLSAEWAAAPAAGLWPGMDGAYQNLPEADEQVLRAEFGHVCDCEMNATARS